MPRPAQPNVAYHVVAKLGDADYMVACLAMILRRDYGEVLAAAARVCKTVWRDGLTPKETLRTARALGASAAFTSQFDAEEDAGVLWVAFRDQIQEHAVVLIEGWVFDPDHAPVSMWLYDDYLAVRNAVPKLLLKVM